MEEFSFAVMELESKETNDIVNIYGRDVINGLVLYNNSFEDTINKFQLETGFVVGVSKITIIAIPNYVSEKVEQKGNLIFIR